MGILEDYFGASATPNAGPSNVGTADFLRQLLTKAGINAQSIPTDNPMTNGWAATTTQQTTTLPAITTPDPAARPSAAMAPEFEATRAQSSSASRVAPRRGSAATGNPGPSPTPSFEPTFGQRVRNFGQSLNDQPTTDFESFSRNAKLVYEGLIQRGVDAGTAEAAARNPELQQKALQAILTTKLGGTNGNKYGKSGAVFEGKDGRFYTAQFGEDGTRKIEPLDDGMMPARGVKTIDDGTGTQIISGATGQDIRRVAKDVAGEAGQKEIGKGLGERELSRPQSTKALESTLSGLDRLSEAAVKLKGMPGLKKITGTYNAALPYNIPGGEAANAAAQLENLKSQAGFAVLQAMRDASKTGGALGAISDKENELLQNNLAALQQSQSFEEFQKNLDTVVEFTAGAKERIQRAYDGEYGDGETSPISPPSSGTSQKPKAAWKIERVQ